MIAIDQFAAHVALDWADKKHDVCVQFKNGERIFYVVEHTPEALDIWLNGLHQKVKGRIAIALELKKGPVVYALQKYPFVTVFPVQLLATESKWGDECYHVMHVCKCHFFNSQPFFICHFNCFTYIQPVRRARVCT